MLFFGFNCLREHSLHPCQQKTNMFWMLIQCVLEANFLDDLVTKTQNKINQTNKQNKNITSMIYFRSPVASCWPT